MMMRRSFAAILALLLASPSWSQVGRIALEAPTSPAPSASAGTIGAIGIAPSLAPAAATGASLTPSLAAPVVSAPIAAPAAEPARQLETYEPVRPRSRQAANEPVFAPVTVLHQAAQAKDDVGRLFDQAPAPPRFDLLSTVKRTEPPAPWRPNSTLLKPLAAAFNAVSSARHERRVNRLGPDERLTVEEEGMQQTLTSAHIAIIERRLQNALDELTRMFKGPDAVGWYRRNQDYLPYQKVGHAYIRFIEQAIAKAYVRAHERSRDPVLVAEARAAAKAGTLLGREYRVTAVQEKDSGHCAQNALFNAIQASAGFVYPVSVARFVERSRAALNVKVSQLTQLRGEELASFQRSVGLKLGVDVGEGMGPEQIKKWTLMLGLGHEARPPPRGDAQWSALFGKGRENLLGLRMFHPRFRHTQDQRDLHGHDLAELRHGVYLLGAFDSPSRGARLYMVQDSGSGATDFYTAEELSAIVDDVSVITTSAPVSLP